MSDDTQVWICGGRAKLTPEAQGELDQFAQYLRLGGKRVFGSFADYQRIPPTPTPSDDKGGTTDG